MAAIHQEVQCGIGSTLARLDATIAPRVAHVRRSVSDLDACWGTPADTSSVPAGSWSATMKTVTLSFLLLERQFNVLSTVLGGI